MKAPSINGPDIARVVRIVSDDGRFTPIMLVDFKCGHGVPVGVSPYVIRFEVALPVPCVGCARIEP